MGSHQLLADEVTKNINDVTIFVTLPCRAIFVLVDRKNGMNDELGVIINYFNRLQKIIERASLLSSKGVSR